MKDRENGSEAGSTGSERATADEASVKHGRDLEANGLPAPEEDESAITSGSAEAAAIDAIALGSGSDEPPDAPEPGEDAEVAAAVRGEPQPQPRQPPPAAPAPAIDFDEADRFAASIRPSWAEVSPVSQQPPRDAIGAVDGAARVIRHNTLLEVSPLRKRRASAYAILLASLVGVASLLYFGISSSSVDHVAHRGLNASDAHPAPHILKPAPEVAETKINPAQQAPAALEGPRPRLAAPEAPEAPVAEPPSEAELAQNEPPPPAQLAPAQPAPELDTAVEPEKSELAAAPEAPAAQPTAAPAQPEAVQPAAAQSPTPALPASGQEALAANAPKEAAPSPQPAAAPPSAPPAAAPADAAPKAVATAPQPAAAAAPAIKPPPSPAKDAGKALLSLAAYPPNTRLRIDGMIVENPYRASLPKYGKHRIEAAAPGFVPETHTLRMEADVQLMIALKRETASDIKSDPYQAESPRRAATTVASPTAPRRDRGAGFVSDNPY